MSKLQFQYDVQNLTPANAQPVEANFTKVEQHINQEVVERDGTVAMRAQLKLVGDPVTALDAAPKQYVDQVLPIGLIMMFAAATPPANGRWLVCDGAALQTAAYPELFAVIGYAWGGSGGSFNTPNLNGRTPIGPSATHPMAQTGGSEDSSLPAHDHGASHLHGAAYTADTDTNHLHGISFMSGAADRPLGTSQNGGHQHTPSPPGENFVTNGVGGVNATIGAGDGYMLDTLTSYNGDHTHAVTDHLHPINGGTGWMDRSNVHSHWYQPPAWNGNTTQTGVAPTGTNMPPFISIPYIIRCR